MTTLSRGIPRIAFMTTLGRNVGDEFIREGIRSFFDEAIGQYDSYYVDKHDLTSLHTLRLDEMEALGDKFAEADIIVQAGAPVYWNLPKSQSWSVEWAQALWYERIFKLGPEKLILNLGAGACQPAEADLRALLDDERTVEFARQAGHACAWTSVRDPLADAFLSQIGVEHELIPCPAFHAARRVNGGVAPAPRDYLAVNLMRLAGHYRLKPQTDAGAWRATVDALLPELRRRHRLLFVAHDQAEAQYQRELARDGEAVFIASDYRDYISVYSRVKGIVANRVHAAVCVAGFGRPAVIVGNDSRIGIARPIGIPARDSAEADAAWILRELDQQMEQGEALARQWLALREQSAGRYVQKIGELTGMGQREVAKARRAG